MKEILMQTGAELSIVRNDNGTCTAVVGKRVREFDNFEEAVEWACAVRDGECVDK